MLCSQGLREQQFRVCCKAKASDTSSGMQQRGLQARFLAYFGYGVPQIIGEHLGSDIHLLLFRSHHPWRSLQRKVEVGGEIMTVFANDSL